MILVRVELHSALTGRVTELARMIIVNDGAGSRTVGNYVGTSYRGRSREQLDKGVTLHNGKVAGFPRQRLHVWNLVARMLNAMGYVAVAR